MPYGSVLFGLCNAARPDPGRHSRAIADFCPSVVIHRGNILVQSVFDFVYMRVSLMLSSI